MDGNGKRVLVVDDHADVRRVLSLILKSAGYNVREAYDGMEAVGEIKKQRYDAVLTDYLMPRMNGRQLMEACRTLCPTTPVIFMSGEFSDPAELLPREVARECAYACLSKPLDARLLLYVVRNAVEHIGFSERCAEDLRDRAIPIVSSMPESRRSVGLESADITPAKFGPDQPDVIRWPPSS